MADATPHLGIHPFTLGMSRDMARAAGGKPESVETTTDEGRSIESWFYEGGSLELEFEASPQARVESITAWSADVTLNDVAIIDAEVGQLARLARQAEIPDLALTDDFGESGQCYQSEEAGLMVWAVKGKVVNFTIFPRFDDSGDEPQWPT